MVVAVIGVVALVASIGSWFPPGMVLGLGLIAVLAGGTLVYLISDTFTRPLAALLEGLHAVKDGDFNYPIEAQGGDELAEVTRAFDGMRGTLQRNEEQRGQLEEQLRQTQKLESLGAKHYIDQGQGGHQAGYFEKKFFGPEGILFDIAEHGWAGAEPLPVKIKEAAE